MQAKNKILKVTGESIEAYASQEQFFKVTGESRKDTLPWLRISRQLVIIVRIFHLKWGHVAFWPLNISQNLVLCTTYASQKQNSPSFGKMSQKRAYCHHTLSIFPERTLGLGVPSYPQWTSKMYHYANYIRTYKHERVPEVWGKQLCMIGLNCHELITNLVLSAIVNLLNVIKNKLIC